MKLLRSFLIVVMMLMMTACAGPKNIFVLAPDPEGNVGRITVRIRLANKHLQRWERLLR